MTEQKRDDFNAAKSLGAILAQIPSHIQIKDSGSDRVIVNSEIVDYNQSPPDSAARETDVVVVFEDDLPWSERQHLLENTELVVFDELSAIMESDYYFRKVVFDWGMLPATLYGHLSRLDHDRVREEIRQVMNKRGLRSKGAYLKTRLGNMK